MALLGRLSFQPPAYTFHLSLAFLFSCGVTLSWAFGTQLSRSRLKGLLAPMMIILMGNLDGFLQTIRTGWPYRIDYWQSSRVIVDGDNPEAGITINEFPFFSFYHADLHAHLLSIPFVILFVVVLYEFFLHLRDRPVRSMEFDIGGRSLFVAICLGSLGYINGLDLPTFGILFMGTTSIGILRSHWSRLEQPWHGWSSIGNHGSELLNILLKGGGLILIILLAAYILYYPFFGSFIAPKEIAPEGEWDRIGISTIKSNIGEFLTLFHLQLFLVVALLGISLMEIRRQVDPRIVTLGVGMSLVLFSILFAFFGYFIFSALISLFIVSFVLLSFHARYPDRLFTSILMTLALAILVGCEEYYIRDSYGSKRMNTLFKFHYQAWILFGLAAPLIWKRLCSTPALSRSLKLLLKSTAMILLVLNLFYPIGVSWKRLKEWPPSQPNTIDGNSYFSRMDFAQSMSGLYWNISHYAAHRWLKSEQKAIEWLNENVTGSPVVLEYPGKKSYHYNARISTNTGLPTLMGWNQHERLWRKTWVQENAEAKEALEKAQLPVNQWSMTKMREEAADFIYQEPNFETVLPVIDQYQIQYIFIGKLERDAYPQTGLAKFEDHCIPVFTAGSPPEQVVLYEVPLSF